MAKFKEPRTDQIRLLSAVARDEDALADRLEYESIPADLRGYAPMAAPKPREAIFAPTIAANPYGPEDGR